MPQKKVIVIEDEPDISDIIIYNLKREGYEVSSANTGELGLQTVATEKPDLVLLDLMLPGIDGLEVCRKIKEDKALESTAVILVTAKGEESDIVLGLGIGADDYITKPFSPREMIARVKAVLRRCEKVSTQEETDDVIIYDELTIDSVKHKLKLKGEEVFLTATEFKILYFLAARPGRVFTREQLINNVLGDNVVIVDRNMDVHIRAIRKKLGDYKDCIETIRGIGYRFKEKD